MFANTSTATKQKRPSGLGFPMTVEDILIETELCQMLS